MVNRDRESEYVIVSETESTSLNVWEREPDDSWVWEAEYVEDCVTVQEGLTA